MKTPHHLSQAILGALVLFTFSATGWNATPVESPVGDFGFDAPDDPPSGPPLITPMVYLNGPYNDPFYPEVQGASTFLTMDAAGKVTAVSTVPGFVEKGSSEVTRYLYVRTVNGLPVLTANASAGGMFNDDGTESATSGNAKATVPLGPPSTAPVNGVQSVTVISSFSGKQARTTEDGKTERNSEKAPSEMNTLEVDVNQLGGVVEKSWGMNLTIFPTVEKGKEVIKARLYFYNMNETITEFLAIPVKYSATAGYTIAFSRGKLLDSDFAPILDTRGRDTIDKDTQIKFTKLLLKKRFDTNNSPYWEPAAGGVNFKFLGQNGFGQVFNFDISLFGSASAKVSGLGTSTAGSLANE